MKIGFAYTMMTPENLAIRAAAASEGVELAMLNDEKEMLSLDALPAALGDVTCTLDRSSAFSRSLCISYLFELHGMHVVNSHEAQRICGDKVLCSAALAKAGIRTPKVKVAFSSASALDAVEEMGYPCVIKPPVGSWGRMVCKITDRHAAEAVISLKSTLGGYADKVYYVQEYVDKPGRDIRTFLIGDEIAFSVCRKAKEGAFLTNLNAGGSASEFALGAEMEEAVHKVGDMLGDGIYGIDLIENGKGGFFVLEVNHAPEFSKSAGAKIGKVAKKIVQFAAGKAKR